MCYHTSIVWQSGITITGLKITGFSRTNGLIWYPKQKVFFLFFSFLYMFPLHKSLFFLLSSSTQCLISPKSVCSLTSLRGFKLSFYLPTGSFQGDVSQALRTHQLLKLRLSLFPSNIFLSLRGWLFMIGNWELYLLPSLLRAHGQDVWKPSSAVHLHYWYPCIGPYCWLCYINAIEQIGKGARCHGKNEGPGTQ